MKRPHPTRRLFCAIAVMVTLAGASGCHNQQALGLTNPFLAPDRVPPPSTRVIAPGTAQPYYPGDQLPVMQSGVAPTNAAANLANTGPTTTAPSEPATPFTKPNLNFTASNEPAVGVPTDNDELRFALPTPPAPAPPTALAAQPQQPTQPMTAPPGVAPVQSATYNQLAQAPPPSQPAPNNYYPDPPGFTAPVEMWRAPDVPPPQPTATAPQQIVTPLGRQPQPVPSPWGQPAAAQPTAVQPTVIQPAVTQPPINQTAPPITPIQPGEPLPQQAPAAIPVRLQAVPPPQLEPVPGSTPRIRIPSPVSASAQPMAVPNSSQQAMYYGPAVPQGGVVQTVQITPLPAYPQLASYAAPVAASNPAMAPVNTPTQTTAVASVSPDGFRPRGSTR